MVLTAPDRFNVRVYGLWIHGGRLLVNEEMIRGKLIRKFPGGGLDLGEGTIDGLKREWKEELGLEIEVLDHFYTTDFYQASAFDNSQVLSIYYWVAADHVPVVIENLMENERTFWMDLEEVGPGSFDLPIDSRVGGMLRTLFEGGRL